MPEWYEKIKARLEQFADGAITEDETLSTIIQIGFQYLNEYQIEIVPEEVPDGN